MNKNNIKAAGILWCDYNHNRNYSIKFGGLIYHVYFGIGNEELEVDIGKILTEIMYCNVNEIEEIQGGNIELEEDFNPHEVIEYYEMDAVYLRQQEMSNCVCYIYEC